MSVSTSPDLLSLADRTVSPNMQAQADSRDLTIDFVRGLCLPLMMVDHLRNHWLTLFTYRPLGFFCAAAIFVFLSGFAVGKHLSRYLADANPYRVYHKAWKRAAFLYALHLMVSAMAVCLARFWPNLVSPFGREIEEALSSPWTALGHSALFYPSAPLLDFLPMYVFLLLWTPWLLRRFQAGRLKTIFVPSFLLWLVTQAGLSIQLPPFTLAFETAGWQFLFVTALYLGFRQHTQPLERPQGTKGLNLSLFGCMVALFMLRHSEVFGLEAFARAIPAWWIDRTSLGPLVLLNLYLWVAFLWMVPEPLQRLARQGRIFIAMGQYSWQVFAWHVLLFYVFMSFFPQLYRYSIWGQALVICFAIVCLIFPISIAMNYVSPMAQRDQ